MNMESAAVSEDSPPNAPDPRPICWRRCGPSMSRRIVDLGCGSGELARALAERWPAARVIGVDSSPEMLQRAGELAIPGRLEFVQADVADWSCTRRSIWCSATPRCNGSAITSDCWADWWRCLSPGGTLAVQMPNNLHRQPPGDLRVAADPALRLAGGRWAASRFGPAD